MNFEPQKIFVGLLDFFAIWLPGAMLTYFLMDTAGPILLGSRYYTLDGAEAWIIFLFSAFLLGHFVFVAGAGLLDDLIYDRLRKATTWGQTARLVEGKDLQWRLTRWLAQYAPASHAAPACPYWRR